MERKNSKVSITRGSKTQNGKKKMESSSSRSTRSRKSKEVKVEVVVLSSDTSESDDIDEDYAEFLKTYAPQESYPYASSTDEEDGTKMPVETK
ncbi:hypothetical protein A2U01_0007164, partial [Trifolium medium]|nr:hypothetical protein [Trifolium medium]